MQHNGEFHITIRIACSLCSKMQPGLLTAHLFYGPEQKNQARDLKRLLYVFSTGPFSCTLGKRNGGGERLFICSWLLFLK